MVAVSIKVSPTEVLPGEASVHSELCSDESGAFAVPSVLFQTVSVSSPKEYLQPDEAD